MQGLRPRALEGCDVKRLSQILLVCALLGGVAQAQEVEARPAPAAPIYNTSYPASRVISARIQKRFLDTIRWSVSAEARDGIEAAFAERPALEIWQELVAGDGLVTGNVADALTAYWVLNWVTANARYNLKIDNKPIRDQIARAMEADPNFRSLNNLQRQEMAEGYILKFLIEHAALNDAMRRKDVAALGQLALASATRFRREMGIDLLAQEPGPDGFGPKAAALRASD
jgi:hypothetical protein